MRLLVLAALIALPSAALAQSAPGGDGGPAMPDTAAAASPGTYGPPAPKPVPAATPPVRTTTGQTDGTQATPHHRGHRRGAYLGADAGAMPH